MLAFLHTIAARIRGFLRPGDLESDFDQEVATHLEMAEEDGLRRGLTVEEARRAARVQLGGITQLRESRRAAWGLPWLRGFALDAKLGLRMLRRSWGLTLAGGLAMTIVITIAAVAFVFLDEFMGRAAPPLDEGERVVALQSWDAEAHRRRDTSRRDLERWGATLQSVVDLGGFQTIERRLMVKSRPAEWVRVAEITASGFRLARVPPLLGRWIAEADEHVAAAPVVVIGYDVWQSRFASDGAVIGQTVRLGEVLHTVVGVMPEGFAFPVIAILIYARNVTRQEEFAARFALGASRGRIVVQLCVEVLVLSSAAGAMALALTRPILTHIGDIIRRLPELGGSLPFWVDFDFSWGAALFVAGLTVLAGLIAGLVPALQATGRVLPTTLRSLGSRTGIPLGATWTALIAAQVALALAGLPSTMELAWGHLRPAVLGPGFAAREFLTARLAVDSQSVPAAEPDLPAFASRARSLQAETVRKVEAELGASAVTFTAALPGAEPLTFVEMDEGGAGGRRVRRFVRANQVDRAFFEVFDVRALAGRTFDGRDFGAVATAIVDQAFVRQVLGDDNALGRRVRPVPAPGSEAGPWYEIVGIVPDRPANTSQGRMYVPRYLVRADPPAQSIWPCTQDPIRPRCRVAFTRSARASIRLCAWRMCAVSMRSSARRRCPVT